MNAMKVSDVSQVATVEPIKRSAPATSPQPVTDRVTVNQDSAVQQAKEAAAEARLAHIEQLEQQIQAGAFEPDPMGIASKMLRSAEISAQIQSLFS